MDHNQDIPYHWMEGDQPRLSDTDPNMLLESLMGELSSFLLILLQQKHNQI